MKTKPYCRAKACGSPLVIGQQYCEFHLERKRDIAAKARATMRREAMAERGNRVIHFSTEKDLC
jgi:hypothetical protein